MMHIDDSSFLYPLWVKYLEMCLPIASIYVGDFNCFLKDDPDSHRFSTVHMVVGKSVNIKVIHCGYMISQTGEHQPEMVMHQTIIFLQVE